MDVLNGPCKVLGVILEKCSLHGGTMGLRVFHPNYSIRNNLQFKWFMLIYSLFFVMTFYSFVHVLGDFVDTAFSLVTFGFLLQVKDKWVPLQTCLPIITIECFQSVVKLYIFLGHRERLLQLSQQFHEIYQRNVERPDRKCILDRFLNYSWMAYRITKVVYYCAGCVLSLVPIMFGVLIGERILPCGIFLPYFDRTTSPGFEINYGLISYLLYLTVNGLTASETYFVLNIFLGMGHLNLIMKMMDDLNVLLHAKEVERSLKIEKDIEEAIKEIALEHQQHFR